jgi:transcriptional regulator with XRE-family HTH domain
MKDFFSLELPKGTPGKIIRAHRNRLGLTLKELEEATGIQESNLSAIENDRTEIGPERAYLIGAALGVDPEFILMPLGYEGRLQKRIAGVRALAEKIRARKQESPSAQLWQKTHARLEVTAVKRSVTFGNKLGAKVKSSSLMSAPVNVKKKLKVRSG